MKSLKNKPTATSLLGIFILSSVIACGSSKKPESRIPITDDMIALASASGNSFLVKLLVDLQDDKQVDVNTKNPGDHQKKTGLHYAAELGATSIIKVLLERGAQINTTAEDGLTPLHSAVIAEKILSVLTLLQYPDLDPNGEYELNLYFKGMTPLILAIGNNTLAIIKLLIADGRVKINQLSQIQGMSTTPLKCAQDRHDTQTDPAKQSICKAIIDALKEKGATE